MKKLQLNGLQLSQTNVLSKNEKNQLIGGVVGGPGGGSAGCATLSGSCPIGYTCQLTVRGWECRPRNNMPTIPV